MKHFITKSIALFTLLSLAITVNASGLNRERVNTLEEVLESYMQLTPGEVSQQLSNMESLCNSTTSALDQTKTGIFFHEAAVNASSDAEVAEYAQKSLNLLSKLAEATDTEAELMPFVTAYQGSAQVLLGEATGKKKEIRKGFKTLDASVENYRKYSFVSRFMRGTTYERTGLRKSLAREDFTMLVANYEYNNDFANSEIMSLAYTSWANLHQDKIFHDQAVSYLKKAISLAPNGFEGKARAQSLLNEIKS